MPLDLIMGLPIDEQRQISADEFVCQTQKQMSDAYELAANICALRPNVGNRRTTSAFASLTCVWATGYGIGTLADFSVNLPSGKEVMLGLSW